MQEKVDTSTIETELPGKRDFIDGIKNSAKKIPVVEIFGPTIEGEGEIAGIQTMFIRFGLCDFKCTKCDSMHAVDPRLVKQTADWLTEEEIFNAVINYMVAQNATHIQHITFSGGNPAIHDLTRLVEMFHEAGKKVFVETQGTKFPQWLAKVDHIVVSPKSPGMGEDFNHKVFLDFFHNATAYTTLTVKIVVFSAQDLEFAAAVAELIKAEHVASIWDIDRHFYLSQGNPNPPVFTIDPETGDVINNSPSNKALVEELLKNYNQLSSEIMKDRRLAFARFLPQLHVLVWGNETGH